MANAYNHLLSANPVPISSHKFSKLQFGPPLITASHKSPGDDFPVLKTRKSSKLPRRSLIKLSTADGKWSGKWSCDYLVTLQDLYLDDLVEDEHKNAEVSINLDIHKHVSFGLSVDGRIVTSFTRKCSNCFASYHKKIDTNFTVWILPPSRDNRAVQLPEIGVDDPSVIYVKPGYEADLDSLIQDTIRLTAFAIDTCSELCQKSEPKLHYIIGTKPRAFDKRWSRLLELRKGSS